MKPFEVIEKKFCFFFIVKDQEKIKKLFEVFKKGFRKQSRKYVKIHDN